jgi:abelson tyrosine-protein kinase 1
VDKDEKIGLGFFSDVYKGTWRGRTVAVKVLAETTPRQLFIREVEIWKDLKHENVLRLYGASNAQGDPPYFFVSPYEKNGSLVAYLKRVGLCQEIALDQITSTPGSVRECDLYRFMSEIAKGMSYLHQNSVLHGDLKVCNIAV